MTVTDTPGQPALPTRATPAMLDRAEVIVIGDGPHPGPDAVAVTREIALRAGESADRVVLLAHTPKPGANAAAGDAHPIPAHWVGPLLRSWADQAMDWAQMQEELTAVRRQVAVNFGLPSLRGTGVSVGVGAVRMLERGRLSFDGPQGTQILDPTRVVIATGAAPVPPEVRGIGETGLHLAESVLDLPERPASVVVFGGGAHGCEMAQGLARAGCTVTLIEPGPRLLADLPDAAARVVIDALQEDGVRMMTGCALASVAPTLDGGAWVGTDQGDVAAEAFVLATGRRPRCRGLDLAAAGVELGAAGQIVVDDRLRSGPVLACGEATGLLVYGAAPGPMARVVAENATSRRPGARFDVPVPTRVTRTDPEVVVVGDPGSLQDQPGGASVGRLAGPAEGSSVQVVLSAPGGRGMLGRGGGHSGRTVLAALLVGDGAAEASGQLALAASAGVPAATLIDIDAPDGTWAAAIQSCVAHAIAGSQPPSGTMRRSISTGGAP